MPRFLPLPVLAFIVLFAHASAAPRTFYFSSNGSDNNNHGKSEATPWRSFSKLYNVLPLQPGDKVLLKRGDTFTGQELYLEGKGTAAAPIELGAYGSGERPIINRGNTFNGICVIWEAPSYVRISQLDCRNSKLGIYLRYRNNPNNFDVHIDDCRFRDMPDPTLDPSKHNFEFAHSDAIFLGGHDWISDPATNTYYTFLDGLRITNCVVENCTHGFGTGWYHPAPYRSRLKNLVMEDNLALNCLMGWASMIGVDGGHMKRCHSIGGGGKDTWCGTALGLMQNSQNYLIQDCVFAYCDRAQSADGAGMDFEGDTHNVVFDRNIIHNNDAAGILILSTDGPNSNITISNNVIYNNALDPWNSEINSEIMGSNAPHTGCSIINNSIYRRSTAINFFSPGSNWSGFTFSGNLLLEYQERPSAWNFNQDGDIEGWGGFNDWASPAASVGKLQGISTGPDPFVESPPLLINPYITPYVWIRMKQSAGNFAQLFYMTAADTAWSGDRVIAFPIIPDGQYHDYFVHLPQGGVTSVVTRIRLDPTIAAGSEMAIDFVRITASNDPAQAAPAAPLPKPEEALFVSMPAHDGHIVESAQDSAEGGTVSASAASFRIGDESNNRAYRTILSFDTSSLPENATVIEATVGIRRIGAIQGLIPIGTEHKTFGDILVDVASAPFNSNVALETADWQAPASKLAASMFAYPAYSDGMTIFSRLESPDLGLVNRSGHTQFRIRYQFDDDFDNSADYVTYGTSNNTNAANHPTLRVRYLSNRPPAFSSNPFTASGSVGVAIQGQLAAGDPDAGDTLTFSKYAGPAWLTVAPDGTLGGIPGAADAGSNSFTARVTDAAGLSDYATLEIDVAPGVADVILMDLEHVYDGTPKHASASTTPGELKVELTYDNGLTEEPVLEGSYEVRARVVSAGYVGEAAGVLVILPNPDGNANGMIDEWEIAMFGHANAGANPPDGDADGDGICNLLEYAFNTPPRTPAPSPAMADFADVAGDEFLRLSVPKNPAASNLSYLIEVCGDLAQGDWSTEQTTIERNDDKTLTVRDNIPKSEAAHRFIRLRVVVAPVAR